MSQVKNLQKENLKLKEEISAVNSELQKLLEMASHKEMKNLAKENKFLLMEMPTRSITLYSTLI